MKKKVRFIPDDTLFGRTMQEIVDFCLISDFPGTKKWPADNPIWDCNIANRLSPRKAWRDPDILMKAVYNMFWIVQKSIKDNKYPDFVEVHKQAILAKDDKLLYRVLLRFTIAKLAPKVTALPARLFLQEVTDVDLSNGVYCPMAGFGGIVEGCQQWFKQNNLPVNIEAYDVNAKLCKYYGWEQRDVLSQKLTTDKVVVVCPPFGTETEQWDGTDSKFLLDMEDWCLLIKEYIKAPAYVFFGPDTALSKHTDKLRFASGIRPNGLFRRKIQASSLPYADKYGGPYLTDADLHRLKEIKLANPWIITDYQ